MTTQNPITEINVIRPSEADDSHEAVHAGRKDITSTFIFDSLGNPTGGHSSGEGFTIEWQNGIANPNGAIIEDVIAAVIQRLEFFQGELPEQHPLISIMGKFRCRENALTITKLQEALQWLRQRTRDRRRRGVEGSYNK